MVAGHKNLISFLKFWGWQHLCPICRTSSRRFLPHGRIARPNAKCPACGLLERHRLVWIYFQTRTDLFAAVGQDILHVAPEKPFEKQIRPRLGDHYLTADLNDPTAMVKMDITDIQYPDASFDIIYCSHVLEHVPDDIKAISELFRVLKPGGWAALMVPVTRERTIEDASVTDPAERLRLYGHEDHVRRYGPDFADRVGQAGFDVTILEPADIMSAHDMARMCLSPRAGEIFHCVKPV